MTIQSLVKRNINTKYGNQDKWVVTAVDTQGQMFYFDSFVGKWNSHWQPGMEIVAEPSQWQKRQYQDRQSGQVKDAWTLKAPPSARPQQYGGQAPQQGFAPQQPQFQQPTAAPVAPAMSPNPSFPGQAPANPPAQQGYNDAELRKRLESLETNMDIVMQELSLRNKPAQEVGAPPVGTGQPPLTAPATTGNQLPPPPTENGMYGDEIRPDEIPQ